jgi:hypothetical protein
MAVNPVDIRNVSFQAVWQSHVRKVDSELGSRIIGAGGATWSDSRGMQSCTIRLTYALHRANVQLPIVPNSWKLKGTGVYLPSLAADIPGLPVLANAERITGHRTKQLWDLFDRKGVVYMGPFDSASGHVSLWNGEDFHFGADDDYLGQVRDVYFWPIER